MSIRNNMKFRIFFLTVAVHNAGSEMDDVPYGIDLARSQ